MSALVQALEAESKVALVRRVLIRNARARLGVLAPRTKPHYQVRKKWNLHSFRRNSCKETFSKTLEASCTDSAELVASKGLTSNTNDIL